MHTIELTKPIDINKSRNTKTDELNRKKNKQQTYEIKIKAQKDQTNRIKKIAKYRICVFKPKALIEIKYCMWYVCT